MIGKKVDLTTIRAFAVWAGATLGVLAFFGLASTVGAISYARLYEDRMFPGIRVLGVQVDGLRIEEARETVQSRVDAALASGVRFRFRGEEKNVDVTAVAADGSVSRELIQYDVDGALDRAFRLGRSSRPVQDALIQLGARLHPIRVSPDVRIDEQGVERTLMAAFTTKLTPAKDATFDIHVTTGTAPLIRIVNEEDGFRFRVEKAMKTLRAQAESLSFAPIDLEEERSRPMVRRTDLEPLENDVLSVLQRPLLTFTFDQRTFVIPTSTLATWIQPERKNGSTVIRLSRDAFHATIRSLAPDLEQEAKNGELDVQDGSIVSFRAGTIGKHIDAEATLAAVEARWPQERTFPLIIQTVQGSLVGEDPDQLGIKEIIGVGRSNFSGSPANRRKNIAKGAEKVNGTLIAPGGEFSMLQTLGPVDGEHGWLPELVIKGNKTEPEFGGGLCQVGTTAFRAALDSGLKITERRNHSYRVRYYEPAGTDATIYEPSPDFRFVNDTGHYVLINAYIQGDDMIFEYWGTSDGRKTLFKGQTEVLRVADLKPKVYNIVSPPAMKLVETLDLPPGKKKCTEVAHNGADADFTYQVTYADGTTSESVFTSHYRPWQAVCLIGVEQLSTPPDTSTIESAVN
jgi:vancomycin resistance protein YoaR